MNELGRFRVEKLRKILGLIERMIVRQRVDLGTIGNISILEPADLALIVQRTTVHGGVFPLANLKAVAGRPGQD